MATVLVVGSVNLDRSAYVERIPDPGQTVLAVSSHDGLGGKGANQAVAAARAGADVLLVGATGGDGDGDVVRARLRAAGVDVTGLHLLPDVATGAAYITIDAVGENVIVVASGANARVDAAMVAAAVRTTDLAAVRAVVAQGELPADATRAAADVAERRGARLVLNLAPTLDVGADVLAVADPLVVNEHEAAELLGRPVPADPHGAREAAAGLVARGSRSAVVSLGAQGAVAADASGSWHQPVPPLPAPAIDTTGAGDALTGVLAAALADGLDLRAALRRGTAAATLAVTRRGAASSSPLRAELDAYLQTVGDDARPGGTP